MKRERAKEQAYLEIIQLCHRTLDSRTLRVELLERLRKVIPFASLFFSTTDPSTLLFTSTVHDEPPPTWALRQFVENELLQEDFNLFHTLVEKHRSVGILSEQTQHELHRSQRYRDILEPLALGDEMRAVFVEDAACWGALCLHRERSDPEYTTVEAAFLARLTPHIAQGLREALLLEKASSSGPLDGPGVLVLSEDGTPMTMNEVAAYWLAELVEAERGDKQVLPHPILTVLTRLRMVERGMTDVHPLTPKITLHTLSGRWLTLYASRLSSPGDYGQFAIVFEAAQLTEIVPLLLQAYHLTKREGEIAQLCLRGQSTKEIAETLHISLNTVQDHLKAIFKKVDVSSRRELAGSIFAMHLQTHLLEGVPG